MRSLRVAVELGHYNRTDIHRRAERKRLFLCSLPTRNLSTMEPQVLHALFPVNTEADEQNRSTVLP